MTQVTTVRCTCPHCEKRYWLGVDGTVDGCDTCLAIIRNPIDNSIVQEDFSSVFVDEEVEA